MNQLIVILSGKKSSGKSSAAKLITKEYLNKKVKVDRFDVKKIGKTVLLMDTFNDKPIDLDFPGEEQQNITNNYGVKLYSFADPLKDLCCKILGLDSYQCYGTEDDKNSVTHISWDNVFDETRDKYKRPRRGIGGIKPASGQMTAREVLQVVGTDIFRRLDQNCWSRALYNKIKEDNYPLAIISDARFPNEITMGTEIGAKCIRLLRNKYPSDSHVSETSLDSLPLGEYSLIVENDNLTMEKTHKIIKDKIHEWFSSYLKI